MLSGPWSARLIDPIILPDGRELETLRDTAAYITGLPQADHDAKEWQTAMETLLLVAEHDGPEMMARIGMMQALNRHINARVRAEWNAEYLSPSPPPRLSYQDYLQTDHWRSASPMEGWE